VIIGIIQLTLVIKKVSSRKFKYLVIVGNDKLIDFDKLDLLITLPCMVASIFQNRANSDAELSRPNEGKSLSI